jgi:hypothetical protein
MTPVPDFIADLLRADTSVKEAKLADDVYGQNLLKMRVIYNILRLVKAGEKTNDKRRFIPKKISKMTNLIAAVAAAIEEDCRVCVQFLLKPLTPVLGISSTSFTTILAWLKRAQDALPSCCHPIKGKRGWRLWWPSFS